MLAYFNWAFKEKKGRFDLLPNSKQCLNRDNIFSLVARLDWMEESKNSSFGTEMPSV